MRVLHADAVIVGDQAPVLDGVVVVGAGGLVSDVGRASDLLARHAGAHIERVHGVILPGLINAHTHLELSALRGRVAGGGGFVPWVEQLIGARAELMPDDGAASIDQAIDELVACGTVAVGEVTNTLEAVGSLARHGLVGCVFHEVFGVEREPLERKVESLEQMVADQLGGWPSADLAYAPTPHTLYTTHPAVVRQLLKRARDRGARTSVHVAEHPAERRFLERGDGPVAEWYERRLKLRRDLIEVPGATPIAFADALGALSPEVLAVHLTDALGPELDLVARRGATVVICPRSNLFIEMRLPPLIAMRTAGIFPALGTDSLASNASLDVLAEARALHNRFPAVPAVDLLRMATWEGARALGRTDVGRIARGTRPGLFAIEGKLGADPAVFVLENIRAPRRWVSRRGEN